MAMVLSHKKHKSPNSDKSTVSRTVQWSKIVAGTERSSVSFTPTFVTPFGTEFHSATTPTPIQLVLPYLKGAEKNSVFIDITDIKDLDEFRSKLHSFNEGLVEEGIEEYLGCKLTTRKYLNHTFVETMWNPMGIGYNTIVQNGLTLTDGTHVRGIDSYSADANITFIELANLPYMQTRFLKKDMETKLPTYGTVLDMGITYEKGCLTGKGYATLSCPFSTSNNNHSFKALQRIMPWEEDGGNIRLVLMEYEDMPKFCRCCQKDDHCRADCPELKIIWNATIVTKKGNCPRNNDVTSVVPNKTIVLSTTNSHNKGQKKPGNQAAFVNHVPPQQITSPPEDLMEVVPTTTSSANQVGAADSTPPVAHMSADDDEPIIFDSLPINNKNALEKSLYEDERFNQERATKLQKLNNGTQVTTQHQPLINTNDTNTNDDTRGDLTNSQHNQKQL